MDFKKILRIIGLILLILLALSGIGLIPPRPTRDFENEVKIELVEERDDEDFVDNENEDEKKS